MNKTQIVRFVMVAAALVWAIISGGKLNTQIQDSTSYWGGLFETSLAFNAQGLSILSLIAVLLWCVLSEKIIQVPRKWIFWLLIAFFTSICLFIPGAPFEALSEMNRRAWVGYILVFFALVAVTGRANGVQWMASAIAFGIAGVALFGLAEYGAAKAADPSWRIFSTYQNPNALASLLAIGLPLCLALLSQKLERLHSLLLGISASLIVLALYLTQSKGGWLAAAVGVFIWLILGLISSKPKAMLPGLACLALGAVLSLAVLQSNKAGGASGVPRVARASQEATQSSEFRKNLWKGAIEQIRANPIGTGIGTYRWMSSRSGLTQPTILAHQTPLQLGVETGALGLSTFLLFLSGWLWVVFKGFKRLNLERKHMLAGIVGAVGAGLSHNMVESSLYHFGIGAAFFALLALGIQSASDGSAPLPLGLPFRRIVPALFLLIAGAKTARVMVFEVHASQGLQALMDGREANFGTALALFPKSGQVHYLRGLETQARSNDIQSSLRFFELAANLEPSPKHLEKVASIALESGDYALLNTYTRKGQIADPGSPQWDFLTLKSSLQQQDLEGALRAMESIRKKEQATYMVVSALPDQVDTLPFEARAMIAPLIDDSSKREGLLKEAADGYQKFLDLTVKPFVPVLKEAGGGLPTMNRTELQRQLEIFKTIASDLGRAQTVSEIEEVLEVVADSPR